MKPLIAAARGRPCARQASQVCAACKSCKKKCDKALPSCQNCLRKRQKCVYDHGTQSRDHVSPARSVATATAHFNLQQPTPTPASLYLEVCRMIRAEGCFVDDITARYFHGIHRHFPIVFRARFHSCLLTARETPSPAFSVLLLTICLITSSPGRESGVDSAAVLPTNPSAPVNRQHLYLTARSLLAQVHALYPPSIHLVQAGILLALFEYACGDPDRAFASVATSARTAYHLGIHLRVRTSGKSAVVKASGDADVCPQQAEEVNTWWGLVICERIIYADVTVSEQPLVTTLPDEDLKLPIETDNVLGQSHNLKIEALAGLSISDLTSVDVGSFGRTAQVASLLDRVFLAFHIPDWDARLQRLYCLDVCLQAFLAMLMHPHYSGRGVACETIAVAIRALFTLHSHILSHHAQATGAAEEWRACSLAALDTVARMFLDIVETNDNMACMSFDRVAPSYTYVMRASIHHLSTPWEREDDKWLQTVGGRLREALDQFNRRWDLVPSTAE